MVTKKPTKTSTIKAQKPSNSRNKKNLKTFIDPAEVFLTPQEKLQRKYLIAYINLIKKNKLKFLSHELEHFRRNILFKINTEGFIPNHNLFLNILENGMSVVDNALSPKIIAAIIQSIITKNDKIYLKLIEPLNEKLILQYNTLNTTLREAINRILILPPTN